MFHNYSFKYRTIRSSLCDFLGKISSKLNEPLKTDTYGIRAWPEQNLETNGHGQVVDVFLGRIYFYVNGKDVYPPMPYLLIEVVRKARLSYTKKKVRGYLEKYQNDLQLEVFVLEYESHTWYKFHRDGTETKTSYCERLDVNLDDGIDWSELDRHLSF